MTGMCAKNNTHILVYVAWTSNSRVISSGDLYYCLLPQCETLCTCRSGFSVVLCPGCEDHARCSLHKKNVLSVWFVVNRRCSCNLLVDTVLNVRFTMNGMCTKNKTHIYVAWTSNKKVISIVACCNNVKLCARAARAFQSQQGYHPCHLINSTNQVCLMAK